MSIDVLIVGAGPTGLTLAAELARFGVDFRIVNIGRGPTDLSKAIGVQPRTLETLDIMGIADDLAKSGNRAKAFHVYDHGKHLARLSFTELGTRFPYLLTVPQSETEHILLDRLESFGKRVERTTTLMEFSQDDAGVTALLQNAEGEQETVHSRWIVGCDGAHSAVRHGAKLPFVGEEYAQRFLLADVAIEWDLPSDELTLFLHDGWIAALFPLPNNRCRVIADLPLEEVSDSDPTLAECQNIVADRCMYPIVLSDPQWTTYYRIHERIVPKLAEGRVFLAGDAAHIHSPAAAQGMNTGIQDAFNLAWKLAMVVRGVASEGFLDSYNEERLPVERGVLELTGTLFRMVSLQGPLAQAARNTLLPILAGTRAFRGLMTNRVSELGVGYHNSSICPDFDHGNPPRSGERAPDAPIPQSGGPSRLYERLRIGKFLLLLFAGHDDEEGEALLRKAATLPPSMKNIVEVIAISNTDETSELRAAYGIRHAGLRLIRPDGYIGLRSDVQHAEEALKAWSDLLEA